MRRDPSPRGTPPANALARARAFIAQANWRRAVTVPHAPHSYTVILREQREEVQWFLGLIRDYGVRAPWVDGRCYRYLYVDECRYWLAPWPLLNRARLADLPDVDGAQMRLDVEGGR